MEIDELLDGKIAKFQNIENHSGYDSTQSSFDQGESAGSSRVAFEAINDLKELKQSLPPKQEKVEVSELIDAWIKHVRALNWGFYDLINPQYANSHTARDIETWLESDKLNVELLAKAWFAADYTVKKEPLYYVVFNKLGGNNSDCYLWMDEFNNDYVYFCNKPNMGKNKFTEKEIKAIDERYWAFAVPVEEI